MKTCTKNQFLMSVLIASLGLLLPGQVSAQIFTTLHSFSATPVSPPWTNSDGADPVDRLTLSGNTLYGTAVIGGSAGVGTVFAVNTDGTGFKNLHSFTAASRPLYLNNDGASPASDLLLSGNTLYGTASLGGSSGNGTVFAINTDGTGFTNLNSFNGGSEGASPSAGLILSGSTLYGTANRGGSSSNGTIFALRTDGMAFTTLYSFTPVKTNFSGFYTNNDGAYPTAGLMLSGQTLYGIAPIGGS